MKKQKNNVIANKYILLIKNTGLFAISSVATKLISFIFLPLYTAYLTVEEYATVDMSIVIQALLWPILSISLTDGLLRFAMDEQYDTKKVFTSCNMLIIPGFAIASIIFNFVNFDDTLFLYRKYFNIYYIVVSINSYLSTFARTINRIKLVVFNSILSSLLIAVFNILFLVKFHMGVTGYLYALIIGNSVSIVAYMICGRFDKYFILEFRDKKLIIELLKYSIPMIPNTIFWWINSSLDKFCLTVFVGLNAVGLYAVAGKISSALNIITSIFSQAWSISAIKEYRDKDSSSFFTNIFNIYNCLVLLMTYIVIIFAKPISRILFLNNFYHAWRYVPILIIAFYFNALNIFYGSIFVAYKKTNLIWRTTGIGAIVNLVLNFFMIKVFGAVGAAIATVISNIVVCSARTLSAKKLIDIKVRGLINCFLWLLMVLLSISVINESPAIVSIFIFMISVGIIIVQGYKLIVKMNAKKFNQFGNGER